LGGTAACDTLVLGFHMGDHERPPKSTLTMIWIRQCLTRVSALPPAAYAIHLSGCHQPSTNSPQGLHPGIRKAAGECSPFSCLVHALALDLHGDGLQRGKVYYCDSLDATGYATQSKWQPSRAQPGLDTYKSGAVRRLSNGSSSGPTGWQRRWRNSTSQGRSSSAVHLRATGSTSTASTSCSTMSTIKLCKMSKDL
jgi:hypothetical protein